jgi:hypothetical protein
MRTPVCVRLGALCVVLDESRDVHSAVSRLDQKQPEVPGTKLHMRVSSWSLQVLVQFMAVPMSRSTG